MDAVLMFLLVMIPQVIICAGIISGVDLLRDILDELERRREHGGKQ
jgi:hypothetical protein